MTQQTVDVQTAFAEAMRWLQPLHDYARDAYCEESDLHPSPDGSLHGLAWVSDVLASVVAYELGTTAEPYALSTWLLGAPAVDLPEPATQEAADLLRAVFTGLERILAGRDGDDFMGVARLLCSLVQYERPLDTDWFGPATARLWSLGPCLYTLGPGDFWIEADSV